MIVVSMISVSVSACHLFCRDNRRNSAFGQVEEPPTSDGVEAINETFLDRPVAEAYNSAILPDSDAAPTTPSVVSQKAAFFAQVSTVMVCL